MKDVDFPKDVESPLGRQHLTQKLPLCATDPNAQLGTAWKAKDIGDCQPIKVCVDDVNIGSLQTTDYQG